MSVPTSGQNLQIDASIATIKNGGSGGLINTGNPINTLTTTVTPTNTNSITSVTPTVQRTQWLAAY